MKKNASYPAIVLFILFYLVTSLSTAWAETQGVATVVALRGTVVAKNKSGVDRNLSIKSQIFTEDVLKTGANGKLQIMFTDNSIISLGRDSEIKIAEYRYQPDQKDGVLRTQVKEGTFRVMGGALAKDAPHNFKTETPTATIGIRGSMYAFKTTQDSLSVVFQGGKGIEVFNDHGKVIITTPGFGTIVLLNAAPTPPAKFTEKQINDLNGQNNGNGTNGNSGGEGDDTGNSAPPLTENILRPPPRVPAPPVLPPTNELPSAPNLSPSPSPPTDGVFAYEGGLVGYSYNSSTNEMYAPFSEDLSMAVNWHNRRILGVVYDADGDEPVFFFGSVSGTTVSDITVFGVDDVTENHDYGFISGKNGVGVFSGPSYDFFSFVVTGGTYIIKDDSLYDAWTAAGGGQQVPAATTPPAPTGQSDWQGFVTGLSVNMTNPDTSPVGIYQSGPYGLYMTLDKDAGTITNGSMTPGNDLSAIFSTISNLQVGGNTENSVYVRDDLIAALIGACVDDCFPSTLKEYGNFMVVAEPSEQFSTYVTWGYWEIAYNDSSTDRIMAAPHSLWIAGSQSNDTVIKTGFTGTYSGGAVGSKIDASGATSLNGTCNLSANFSDMAYPSISGNITFPDVVEFIINSGSTTAIAGPSSNSFSASIAGGGTIGSIKGAFFGPAANAVGGNFFSTDGTTSYLGIFGGKKTDGSLSAQ